MSAHDDLPLFAWRPPKCAVLPFPSRRRVAKIRQTADTLMGASTEKQIDRYRQQIFDGIENAFLRVGFDEETARRERQAFVEAVENEIRRRTYGGWRSQPDEGAS
ncbi:DUF6074 family protein [Jiella sp. M17.18]|uniref:DUF6074 family protein n=1 Tax=Jiella sp. M17.18 TaxID=3234247 RepID=UPI0034DFDF30